MHILYLHQHFVARSGTSGGRSHEFSRILVERGHRVTLITGAYDHSGLNSAGDRLMSRATIDGIDVIVLNVPYGQHMSTMRRIYSFLQFMVLASWVASLVKKVDVVFATSTPLTIAVPGMIASVVRRCAFVFEVRDLWPDIPIQLGLLRNPIVIFAARLLEKLAYRRAKHIVALSPGMKAGVVESGVDQDKVTVIPNSSDVGLFRVGRNVGERFRMRHPEWGHGPLLVYAGAFGLVNGLEYAVRLAEMVAERGVSMAFVLAGKGSEKQQVTEDAQSANVLGKSLFIIDPLPRSELAELLSAADILASFVISEPVLEANSANKFFDAFAAGKPIAINYGGWQAEILSESGAGIVLDPHDLEMAAEQIIGALGSTEWMRSASAASRSLGDERFDRRRLAVQFERVLLNAV